MGARPRLAAAAAMAPAASRQDAAWRARSARVASSIAVLAHTSRPPPMDGSAIQSRRLPRVQRGQPAKQKSMLLECLALFSAPRDWDAHKWEQQRASAGDCALTSRRVTSADLWSNPEESSRVVTRRWRGVSLLAACKTLGIPKPLAL